MSDPRKQSPLVLANYPYRDKFTPAQVAEALDRKDRLVDLLMDPVGPDGTLINIPVDMMHILAFHLAYAGADTHTDARQLIESRVVRDQQQMFEVYEWRPRGDFTDSPAAAEPDTEAAGIAAQMKNQLTPEVRAAVVQLNGLLADTRKSMAKVDAVLADMQVVGGNAREASTDLGALRAEVESNLLRLESVLNDLQRKWPFSHKPELKLP